MFKLISALYKKYEDIILYLFWGAMAFFLNIILYIIFTDFLCMDEMVANILDWLLCVLFAYTTNRTFVFKSKINTKDGILKEFSKFFSMRVVSGLMDIGLFFLMVSVLFIDDIVSKLVTQVVVIVSNYLFSKFYIFAKKK